MQRFGWLLGRILLVLVVAGGLIYWFGPREEVNLRPTFDPRKFGEGVQVYFESTESAFDNIVPGVEKRVIWQEGFKEQRTPYSVLYVHGFFRQFRRNPTRAGQGCQCAWRKSGLHASARSRAG